MRTAGSLIRHRAHQARRAPNAVTARKTHESAASSSTIAPLWSWVSATLFPESARRGSPGVCDRHRQFIECQRRIDDRRVDVAESHGVSPRPHRFHVRAWLRGSPGAPRVVHGPAPMGKWRG